MRFDHYRDLFTQQKNKYIYIYSLKNYYLTKNPLVNIYPLGPEIIASKHLKDHQTSILRGCEKLVVLII